jgi:AcrR family transcriptional regulator
LPKEAKIRRKATRDYHHGDLKAALVAAATQILRQQGSDALTLRAVAAATGVTATATYRHFVNRRHLVAAVAQEGFLGLQGAMLEGIRAAPGRLGLKQVAFAYVRFAHAHPAEYRVMFGPEVADARDLPGLQETSRSVLAFVAQGIAQLQAAGLVRAGNPVMLAITTWAALHGLVMLSLDGQKGGTAPSIEALVEEMTQVMMFGMAPRAEPPRGGALP